MSKRVNVRSMTGFGRGESGSGDKKIIVEIATVNSKYADFSFRGLPSNFAFEERLKTIIGKQILRGKVRVTIEGLYVHVPKTVSLNQPMWDAYLDVLKMVGKDLGVSAEEQRKQAFAFLQLPNMVLVAEDASATKKMEDILRPALEQALRNHAKMCQREGGRLGRMVLQQAGELKKLTQTIEKRAPVVLRNHRQRLVKRVGELNQLTTDEQAKRLREEVGFYADKIDISEEIVRIYSHLKQLRTFLLSGESIGRSLEFLVQELLREINTTGAKANDAAISHSAVAFKTILDRIREQAQNLE